MRILFLSGDDFKRNEENRQSCQVGSDMMGMPQKIVISRLNRTGNKVQQNWNSQSSTKRLNLVQVLF